MLKIKAIVILSITMILMLFATACSKPINQESPLLDEINSIEINHQGMKKTLYTKDKDYEYIKEFIIAFNEAIPADNSLGTTPNSEVIINYTNGEKVYVSGGTQGFQTVVKGDKQFNIKGDKLWDYFKGLNKVKE